MKIEILYSEVANLYGDMANIEYLKKSLPKAKFIYTSLHDKPTFISEKVNLVYLGPMSENSQKLVIDALKPYTKEIKDAIKNGINFLVTGNATEIFGEYIETKDGNIEALKIFKIHSKQNMMKRYNSIEIGEFKKMKIVGFKSSFTEIYGNAPKFIKIIRGYGNDKTSDVEGICKNNFIATTLLGPILILNPLFTKYLYQKMGVKKTKLLYEKEMFDAYNKRVEEFLDPKRSLD